MAKYFLLILLLAKHVCFAQNYQCVQSNVKHYFTNGNGYLRGIRIDSVRIAGSDTIYYPYKSPRIATLPYDTTRGSWLGSRIVQKNDGSYLFNTIWMDTVIIKTQAAIGDSWMFYNDTSSRHYMATVVAADTMTVIGIIDSVKKINITAYAGSVINTADPINNFQLLLSKNNGFVQVFDLYTFPYHSPDVSAYIPDRDAFLDATCVPPGTNSITSPDTFNSIFTLINYHDPSKLEICNFSIGDVFFWDSVYSHSLPSSYILYSIENSYDSIISKTVIDAYHTQYEIFRKRYKRANTIPYNTSDADVYTFTADTSLLIKIDGMPEEREYIYYYRHDDTTHCYKSDYYEESILVPFFEGAYYKTYKVGFEKLKYNQGISDDYTGNELISSIKNNVICGESPAHLLSLKVGLATVQNLTIFPNPATKQLTISAPNIINYVIISNVLGQIVYSHHYESSSVAVDVSQLSAGVYVIKINDEVNRRFIKK